LASGMACSNEMLLVTLCSVFELSEVQMQAIGKVASNSIKWDMVYEHAKNNGVYPTVFRNLSMLHDMIPDQEALRRLQDLCKTNQIYSLKLLAELIRLTDLFKKQGIRVISIKGPLLSLKIYGDVSMRSSRDLDLLVDPADIDACVDILLNAGFELVEEDCGLSPKQKKLMRKAIHHHTFISQTGISVELHWNIMRDYSRRRLKRNGAGKRNTRCPEEPSAYCPARTNCSF